MLARSPCPEYSPHRPGSIVTIHYNSRRTKKMPKFQYEVWSKRAMREEKPVLGMCIVRSFFPPLGRGREIREKSSCAAPLLPLYWRHHWIAGVIQW